MEQRTPKMSNRNMIALLVMIHKGLFIQCNKCGENEHIMKKYVPVYLNIEDQTK